MMFEVGDKVRIVGDHHGGRKGIIRRVYDDAKLYPYRVEFPGDPYWALFTADEMERID